MMKLYSLGLLAAGLITFPARAESVEKPWFQRSPTGQKALEVLRASTQPPKEAAGEEFSSRVTALRAALREASQLAPNNVLFQEIADAALKKTQGAAEANVAVAELDSTVRKSIQLLSFEPVMEADLPTGFPPPTPVGEIAVKDFPAYRAARTNMTGETFAFWRLFAHITTNQIAMTAPVEVTYASTSSTADAPIKRQSMAFLYGDPNLGKPHNGADVSVLDLQPARYVSIGMRGDWNSRSVSTARQHLERWLKAHSNEYQPAGNLRMMGYNSPKVPVANRYFEVELPIESVNRSVRNQASVESTSAPQGAANGSALP